MSPRHRFLSLLFLDSVRLAKRDVCCGGCSAGRRLLTHSTGCVPCVPLKLPQSQFRDGAWKLLTGNFTAKPH